MLRNVYNIFVIMLGGRLYVISCFRSLRQALQLGGSDNVVSGNRTKPRSEWSCPTWANVPGNVQSEREVSVLNDNVEAA